jgi:poly(3-hydroxybutyrate) depolymerase
VLYTFVDMQRRLIDPMLSGLRLGAEMPPLQRLLMAQHTLLERTLRAGDGVPVPIEAAVARDHPGVSSAETVDEGPFSRLVRLRGARGKPAGKAPTIFVVAPYSGYAGAVLGELAAALLPMGDLYFLDWTDARFVPTAFGPFGLSEQLAVVLGALKKIDQPAHVLGVSQSGGVTLAAAAVAAASGGSLPPPSSLALLGSPIGAARTRSAADWLLAGLEPAHLESSMISVVPDRFPGAGRRVYPGILQLLALCLANPTTYLQTQAGLWAELITDKQGPYTRQHGDLHRVADVPAEIFTEQVHQLMREPVLSTDGIAIGKHRIPDGGLKQLPILTIEAGRDELVGAGATHAAQVLGNPGSSALTVETASHYTLFGGAVLRQQVAPRLRAFIGKAA